MAGEVQQKYSRKENLNEKKKNSCTPSYPKKIFMHLPEKIHLRETLTKKNAARNLPTPHITFLIVGPYVWKQVLPSQKGNWRMGKNSKILWERPFPGDTRWLREGTESLTPAEYPWDNDYNRTWLQCRGLIQDYTAGRVRNITKENLTKHQCKYSTLMTRYRLGHVLAR